MVVADAIESVATVVVAVVVFVDTGLL